MGCWRQIQFSIIIYIYIYIYIIAGNIPVCAGCQTSIVDRYILKVLDKPWHAKCLRCSDCQIQLTDKCYSKQGQVFCKDDFSRLEAKCNFNPCGQLRFIINSVT